VHPRPQQSTHDIFDGYSTCENFALLKIKNIFYKQYLIGAPKGRVGGLKKQYVSETNSLKGKIDFKAFSGLLATIFNSVCCYSNVLNKLFHSFHCCDAASHKEEKITLMDIRYFTKVYPMITLLISTEATSIAVVFSQLYLQL